MLAASRGSREPRVARQVFVFHCGAQLAPVVVIAAHDRKPLVFSMLLAGGRINAVGRETGVGISDPSIDAAVYGVVENRGTEKMNRAFRLRLIDILALAGAAPIIERRKNRHRSKPRRHVIGVRTEESGRRPVGPSGEIVES